MNHCGDIKYINLKSATLWSSPKISGGSWGSSNLSFMSLDLTNVEICFLFLFLSLPLLNQICRKLLFNNSKTNFSITSLLITFCQEGPQMLCAKFRANRWNRLGGVRKSRFSTFCDVAKKNGRRKWAWPIPRDSPLCSERVDIRFLNVRQSIWELLAKTHFP